MTSKRVHELLEELKLHELTNLVCIKASLEGLACRIRIYKPRQKKVPEVKVERPRKAI